MLLLISDANILIDIQVGGLLAPMFSLDYRFAVPDVLFYEELEGQHRYLLGMGIELQELDESMIEHVVELARRYPRPGRNDLFSLVLAVKMECPLLTGDKDLKAAAESEHVRVHGTLWLVSEMVRTGKISVLVARGAYHRMRVNGRRLPWDLVEKVLTTLDNEQPG